LYLAIALEPAFQTTKNYYEFEHFFRGWLYFFVYSVSGVFAIGIIFTIVLSLANELWQDYFDASKMDMYTPYLVD